MIKQVNGSILSVCKNDPRRKAQSVQFKHRSTIPYKQTYKQEYAEQKRRAMATSISIVAGSVLFTFAYFLISAMRSSGCLLRKVV